MKALVVLAAFAGIVGCGRMVAEDASPSSASIGQFVGRWRSTTPSLEFVRLEMASPVAGQPTIAAHLTLSGAAFDAAGPIDGDSVVAPMSVAGATQVAGTLIIRALRNGTLSAQLRSTGNAPAQTLTFVRE